MKNLITLLFVLILPFGLSAQTKGEKLYNKYANKENVISFNFGGSFLPDLDLDIDDDGIKREVKGSYKTIKFLSFGTATNKAILKQFKSDVNKLSRGGGYKEIQLDDEAMENNHFYAKGNGKKFTEFHILNIPNKGTATLISFYGNFTVKQLKGLAKSKIKN